MTMCGTWAYNDFQKYAAVFPEIVDILSASGVKAEVRDNADKTGLLVKIALAHQTTAVLNDGERDNWSIDLGGEVIELGIPVENRDATAIAAALLKAIGK